MTIEPDTLWHDRRIFVVRWRRQWLPCRIGADGARQFFDAKLGWTDDVTKLDQGYGSYCDAARACAQKDTR